MVAAVYARKSNEETGKDQDSKSCARQVQRAKEYASKRGWTVDPRFVFEDDGISGAEWKRRPGLNALVAALEPRPPFQVLIVSEQSRLGRDVVRTLYLIQQVQDAGVKLYSYLDDREITLAEDTDEIQEFIRGWASGQERRKAQQRTRDAMRQRAEKGRLVGGRLYGYRTRDGRRVIEPEEAEVVRRIFRLRAQGWGHYRIAGQLEKDKIPSPRTGKPEWWPSQIGSISRNETYHGVLVWGRTRQTKRRGTTATVKSPDAIIRFPDESLRIIPEKVWREVQAVNKKASAATWRNHQGQLLSRPTTSKWLLSPFLACGICGGSMHVRQKGQGTPQAVYFCTNRHLRGKSKCSNARGLKMDFADKAILQTFEQALASQVVLAVLEEALEERRRASVDPVPLRKELGKLQAEVARLVAAIADGADVSEVRQAIADRKAKIEHVQGQLSGTSAVRDFNADDFKARVIPVLADWKAHLKKNPSVAQQVLRKIVPEKIKATPQPNGSWKLTASTDYTSMLKEIGYAAVLETLKEAGVLNVDDAGLAKAKHHVNHPADECRPEYACWSGNGNGTGTKLSKTRCPSPCSDRPSATCTTPPRRTPRR